MTWLWCSPIDGRSPMWLSVNSLLDVIRAKLVDSHSDRGFFPEPCHNVAGTARASDSREGVDTTRLIAFSTSAAIVGSGLLASASNALASTRGTSERPQCDQGQDCVASQQWRRTSIYALCGTRAWGSWPKKNAPSRLKEIVPKQAELLATLVKAATVARGYSVPEFCTDENFETRDLL